jgi:hypothetical protein
MRAGLQEEVRAGGTLPVRPGSLAGVNLRERDWWKILILRLLGCFVETYQALDFVV